MFGEDFDQQQDIHRSLRTGLMPEVVYGRNEPALIPTTRRWSARSTDAARAAAAVPPGR